MKLRQGLLDESCTIGIFLKDFYFLKLFAVAGVALHEDVPILALEKNCGYDDEMSSANSCGRPVDGTFRSALPQIIRHNIDA